jgi:hypothetical protein
VAVLEFAGSRNAVLIHDSSGDAFFRIATPFRFRPSVAHVGSKLRIAGQCLSAAGDAGGDANAGCMGPLNNPVFQFNQKPDGGAW